MQFSSLAVYSLSAGSLIYYDRETESSVSLTLTEEESDRIRLLADEIFELRQQQLAKTVAAPLPRLGVVVDEDTPF